MGAGSNTTSIVCTQTSKLNDMYGSAKLNNEYDTNITTLSQDKINEITKKLSNLNSHEEELEKLKDIGAKTPILPSEIGTDFNFKRKIVWKNVIGFAMLHLVGIIGILMMLFGICDIRTTIYSFLLIYVSGIGVTMGAHRLWAHRSYKAKPWLRFILLFGHTLAGQNCLWVWVRDHRQHHKYSDTDADPHNANRGFFFSHIGWLLSRKHPKVIEYGKKVDMSDLEADSWIMFQKNYYKTLYTLFALGLPTIIPILCWNEDPFLSLMVAFFGRTILALNGTWLVNSAAHLYGTRPFDKTIFPVESWVVSLIAVGEGWHNYHHAFPWDYRASEYGSPLNLSTMVLDILAKFGAAYDLKEATHAMVKHRVLKTGDESHHTYGTDEGRKAVKTLFNILKHPLNPTYNSIYSPKPKIIRENGYALIEEEIKICEEAKLGSVDEENNNEENKINANSIEDVQTPIQRKPNKINLNFNELNLSYNKTKTNGYGID